MKTLLKFGAFCAAFALLATGAQAAVIATLTFDQPTGVVSPTDPVPVFVTLTLSADSDALVTDSTGQVTSGLTDQDIIDAGYDPTLMTRRIVNNAFECGGTFSTTCIDPPPYGIDFNYGAQSFIGAANLNLQAGSSTQFLFGTFMPAGAAPAGTYTFYKRHLRVRILRSERDRSQRPPREHRHRQHLLGPAGVLRLHPRGGSAARRFRSRASGRCCCWVSAASERCCVAAAGARAWPRPET